MLLKLDDIDCSAIRDRVVHLFTVEAMVDATEKAWAQSWAEQGDLRGRLARCYGSIGNMREIRFFGLTDQGFLCKKTLSTEAEVYG
jgi:hypothetical protein